MLIYKVIYSSLQISEDPFLLSGLLSSWFIIITAIRIKTVKGGDSPSFNLMVILKKNHAHPLVLLKAVYRTAIVHDQAKITGWLR